jgi:hypothetical protein
MKLRNQLIKLTLIEYTFKSEEGFYTVGNKMIFHVKLLGGFTAVIFQLQNSVT